MGVRLCARDRRGRASRGHPVHRRHLRRRRRLRAPILRHVEQVLVETMGGGVALLDYDNDGRLDVFFTNGAKLDDPMPAWPNGPTSPIRRCWNRLYRQTPDGTFADVTEKAGLTGMPQNDYGMGVAVERLRQRRLRGSATSPTTAATRSITTTATARSPTSPAAPASAPAGWSASAGFFDADNDGKLDLFVTRYVDWTFETNRYCGRRSPAIARIVTPTTYAGVANILLPQQRRRHVHGRLHEGRHRQPQRQGAGRGASPITIATASWTSTWPTTPVQSFLYHNNRDGTFTEESACSAGVGFNEDGKTFAGMGVDFADYDNDGRPDIVVTGSLERALQAVSPERRRQLPVTRRTRPVVGGAHAAVFRLEHALPRLRQRRLEGPLRRAGSRDGHDREDRAQPDAISSRRCSLRNESGRFSRGRRRRRRSRRNWAGRGAAFGDLDNDGDIDVVAEQRRAEGRSCCRNDGGNRSNWLTIEPSARRRIAMASAAG